MGTGRREGDERRADRRGGGAGSVVAVMTVMVVIVLGLVVLVLQGPLGDADLPEPGVPSGMVRESA
jgi:hypothetical protein